MKNPTNSRRQLPLILAGSLAMLLAVQSVQAANATWGTEPASANWTEANWTGVTTPGSGDALIFGDSSSTDLNNDLTTSAFVLNSITFNAGAPAYVISGNAFTLGTTTASTVLSNNSTSLQTINDDIVWGNATQTVKLNTGGGNITLGGTITSGGVNSSLATSGAGTLTFKGAATFNTINPTATTTLKVDGGNLAATIWGGGTQATGTVQVTNGGTFSATGLTTNNHAIIQDSGSVVLGSVVGDSISRLFLTTTGGTALIKGNIAFGLNLDASGSAQVTYNNATSMTNGDGLLNVAGNAAVTFSNGLNLAGNGAAGNATINLNGGTLTLGGTGLTKSDTTSISTINLNGGNLQFSSTSSIFSAIANATFNVMSGGAIIDTQGNSNTINQSLVSGVANDGGLTKLGSGNLTLGKANTFTGDTVINAGTLTLGNVSALQYSTLNYDNQGGVLSFGSLPATGVNIYLGGLKGSQGIAMTNLMQLAVGGNNQDTTYSGNLTGAGRLVKLGTGTLTLTGTNTYTSQTYINEGILSIGSMDNIGGNGILHLNGGTLKTTGGVALSSSSRSITFDPGTTSTIDVSNTGGLTIGTTANVITGSGNLVKTGAGTLTLGNSTSISGTTTVQQGTLFLNSSQSLNNSIFNTSGAGTLGFGSFSTLVFGGLVGNGTFTLPGTITSLTAGASNFDGDLTASSAGFTLTGASKVATYTGTSSIGGDLTVSDSTTLKIDGGSFTVGGGWGAGGSGTVQVTNGGRFTSVGVYDGKTHYLLQDSGTVTLGTGSNNLRLLNITTTGGAMTLNGILNNCFNINASGSAAVNITGPQALVTVSATAGILTVADTAAVAISGTLDLSTATAATYGGTVNLNGGVLTLAGIKKTNTASASNVNFNGGKLRLSASGTMAATGNTSFNVLSGGAAIDTQANTVGIDQALISGGANDGGLTKYGTGKLTLNGVNTYTGATTVTSGTLALGASGSIDNSTAIIVGNTGSSGAVLDLTAKSGYNILSGQTLKGIGNLNIGAGKTITVDSGAHWTPGNSIGSNSVTGNLTLSAGSSTDIELGTASASKLVANSSTSNDRTSVSGALVLGGTLNLIDDSNASLQGSAGAGSYRIFSGATSVSGDFSNIVNVSGFHAAVDKTASDVYVDLNYYAQAAFAAGSSGTVAPIDATTFTLSLGAFAAGSGEQTATFTLTNVMQDEIYQDLLSGAFDISGKGDFSFSGYDAILSGITSGSNITLTVSFNTDGAEQGMHYGTILFNATSVNASGSEALAPITLGLEFEVVPEPATWSMIVGGLGLMAFVQRARRRMSS